MLPFGGTHISYFIITQRLTFHALVSHPDISLPKSAAASRRGEPFGRAPHSRPELQLPEMEILRQRCCRVTAAGIYALRLLQIKRAAARPKGRRTLDCCQNIRSFVPKSVKNKFLNQFFVTFFFFLNTVLICISSFGKVIQCRITFIS